MLNQFLSQLKLNWETPHSWIYVIFNAMWNGEEIDLVCFTPNAIIVADLKNYSGHLKGAENGPWELHNGVETIEVKGGRQINPYVQIRKNKFALIDYLKDKNYFSNSNINFVTALVIFNELESCSLDLPHKVRQWLRVSDLPHCSQNLESLYNSQINLNEEEVKSLIQAMKLKHYQWQHNEIKPIRFYPFEKPKPTPQTQHISQQEESISIELVELVIIFVIMFIVLLSVVFK